jgi:hypothetical protein
VVRGGNDDGVNGFVGDDLTAIHRGFASSSLVVLVDHILLGLATVLPDVTNSQDLSIFVAEEIAEIPASLSTHTDASKRNTV